MSRIAAAIVIFMVWLTSVMAHPVVPAVADLSLREAEGGNLIDLSIRMPLEGILAGIDHSAIADTNDAPQAADYDRLRASPPDEIEDRFRADWARFAGRVSLTAAGSPLVLTLESVSVNDVAALELARPAVVRISAPLPPGATSVQLKWDAAFGAIVVNLSGASSYVSPGETSPELALNAAPQGAWSTLWAYIPIGFEHIVPAGADHILFVLGLCFLSLRLSSLLWQVTAFTLAHSVTLGLATLGYVSLPAAIVEPLIAASIVYVAVENILSSGMNRWRPLVVFGFGLLHGLGFASVLAEFGLPQGAFVPALIGFNIGVELGQLFVIAVMFATVGYWFGKKPWYRKAIAIPASTAIALMAAWWVLERTVL